MIQDSIFPWATKKYEKRINRLLLIIILLKTNTINEIRVYFERVIESYKNLDLSNIFLHKFSENNIISNQILILINEWLDKFLITYYESIINLNYILNDDINTKFCKIEIIR
jgi:hypothetical protein